MLISRSKYFHSIIQKGASDQNNFTLRILSTKIILMNILERDSVLVSIITKSTSKYYNVSVYRTPEFNYCTKLLIFWEKNFHHLRHSKIYDSFGALMPLNYSM